MSRGLKLLLGAFAAAVLLVATLPWWLGAVLRPVLRAQGVTFKEYTRDGYTRFQLHAVTYPGAGFRADIAQVEAVTPVWWLAQRLRGNEPALTVAGWHLIRTPVVADPARPALIRGLPDLRAVLERVGPQLVSFLPRARLTTGSLEGFGPDLAVATIDWQHGTLTVSGLAVAGQEVGFTLTPAADGSLTLDARTADEAARLHLVLTGSALAGTATWWDQPLQLTAQFPATGWLPTAVRAVAADWRLPASRLKLGANYTQVEGEARLLWRDGSFEASLAAKATPAADAKNAPPFSARAAAHGTLRELTLTLLDVEAPFATAKLSSPVTFGFDRPIAGESAQLTVQADLARLPWIEARGQVEGHVTVTGHDAVARQEFALTFRDVALRNFSVQAGRARGTLAWPHLDLAELAVQLDDTSSLQAHGRVNGQTRELAGVAVEAKLGAAWFSPWLPAGLTWTTAELSARADGPLAAPRHEGSLKLLDAHLPPLHPLALEATWQGTGAAAELTAVATASDSTVTLAGSLAQGGLRLQQLTFSPDGGEGLALSAPIQLTWSPQWQVDEIKLTGPTSSLSSQGEGGPAGNASLLITGFPSAWLQDWVTITGPAWHVESFQATGRIEADRLVFNTTLAAQIALSPQPAAVRLVARGDARGVELQDFTVMAGERRLTSATGRLPLVWQSAPQPRLLVDEDSPLELSASTEPDSPLWATLASATGIELEDARARAEITGTLRQPAGSLEITVGRLGLIPGRLPFTAPELTAARLALEFGRTEVSLPTFTARLDGQAVSARGRMPMNPEGWRQLWRDPAKLDWREATARVEIPDADLAPLARRFPQFLAAQGRLRASVELRPGGRLAGELRLTDAASRPLPPLGTLQQINADLQIEDRTLTVRALTATLGGEPVTLAGSVAWDATGAPRYALNLKGKNLPLVRNTGLLLRTDLDLTADTADSGLTRLGGTVTVRDCLVLASLNLRTLLPTGPRGVSRQPPYFAVTAAPFNRWPLAVELRAPGTVRLRTPVYHGTASARFKLGGTLGEPRAVGELTVDQGQVLFPFATFQVQQGSVRLREADPFHAVVSLNATAQRRDYQLRLELTGELPSPNLVLSSSPAMEAADALLMVMTGQPPAGNPAAAGAGGTRLALLGAYLGRGLFQDLGFGGEDRLEISAGERISRDGRDTYEFEYKLGGRWSLQGEYDQFDSYNAGLKWRAYTQESEPREEN